MADINDWQKTTPATKVVSIYDLMDIAVRTMGNPPPDGYPDSFYTVLKNIYNTLFDLFGVTFVQLPAINNGIAQINEFDPNQRISTDLGTYTVAGALAPGAVSSDITRIKTFQSIWFVVTAVVGAPVISFEASIDGGTNWEALTFARSNNTANVNSITGPAVSNTGIITLKPFLFRLRVVGAGTSVTVKVVGIN
jgi:hypothetical protein